MFAESGRVTALTAPADQGAPVSQLDAPAGRCAHFLPFFALGFGIVLTPAWGLFLAWEIVITLAATFE
jgi:hypothetical protein